MPTPSNRGFVSQVKGSHLIVQELRDELVIFDRRTNKAHLLDARAAAIYRAAENGCSVDDLGGCVEGKTAAQRQAGARLAIQDLQRAGVVETDLPRMPRRGLLKTLGAAAAMPMVISILAPTPAAAASNLADGASCAPGDTCATVGRTCVTANGGDFWPTDPAPRPRCCLTGQADTFLDGFNVGGNAATCCSGATNGVQCVGN